ncbi:MAG TPA: hypothetical protein VG675_05765 [Bryobacteraceae bacterium]|nr:hypothetical protein [Bryobacteraceae bacterium]
MMEAMGFYLWVDGETAWAQGSYEYRPMGTAVIAASDLFRQRDFRARRHPQIRTPETAEYLGQFASLGHVNAALVARRKGRR